MFSGLVQDGLLQFHDVVALLFEVYLDQLLRPGQIKGLRMNIGWAYLGSFFTTADDEFEMSASSSGSGGIRLSAHQR